MTQLPTAALVLVAALAGAPGAQAAQDPEGAPPASAPPASAPPAAVPRASAPPVGSSAANPEQPLPPKPPKKSPELLEAGKKLYELHCLACHGEKGDGNGPVGQALVPKPRDFAKDPFKQGSKPDEVFLTLTHGVKDTAMVGYPQLSDDERWALTFHVLEMLPKKGKDAKVRTRKDASAP